MSVKIDRLTKLFGSQIAVNEVSFQVVKGEIVGFLGPNGAGKTTTMKMLTCYLKPSSGTAEVCGYSILNQPIEVKRQIGYLPEHNPLYKDMFVVEYLTGMARMYGIQKPMKRASELIGMTGLSPEMNKSIGALSKGYRQRIGLAQALLHDPQVLILDEPTSGLDPNQLIDIRKLIREIGKEKSLIFSTHIMQEVQALCDRVVIINKGMIAADQSIASLQETSFGHSLMNIEFSSPVSESTLKKLPGVFALKNNGLNRFELQVKDPDAVADKIFQFAIDQGTTIRELVKEKHSVEEIFTTLTGQQKYSA